MATGTAAVFIDNGYLAKLLKFQFNEQRFDYLKFSNLSTDGYKRLRTYVYDCLPYQSDPPTPAEIAKVANAQKFFNTLKMLPSVEPRFGKLRKRTGGELVQKGVDVLLATDLVRLSLKARIEKAVILTGDADYVPSVEVAKDEGVSISLYHGSGDVRVDGERVSGFSNELWDICDERILIDQNFLDKCKYEPMGTYTPSMKFHNPNHPPPEK